MQNPKVTIITGTWNREAFLPAIHACVRSQTYDNIEWIVFDDSDTPSVELSKNAWDKLTYIHSKDRVSIGEKRNRMVAQAKGEIIVNFDDDDFYGPNYVTNRVKALTESGCKLSIMSGFFVYHLNNGRFGYYRTRVKQGPAFQFNKFGMKLVELSNVKIPYIQFCFGWSFVFYKSLWDSVKFPDQMIFEDRAFAQAALEHTTINFYDSTTLDSIHAIHNLSSSSCFPQFIIPPFMIASEGMETPNHMKKLVDVVRELNQTQPKAQTAISAEPQTLNS